MILSSLVAYKKRLLSNFCLYFWCWSVFQVRYYCIIWFFIANLKYQLKNPASKLFPTCRATGKVSVAPILDLSYFVLFHPLDCKTQLNFLFQSLLYQLQTHVLYIFDYLLNTLCMPSNRIKNCHDLILYRLHNFLLFGNFLFTRTLM